MVYSLTMERKQRKAGQAKSEILQEIPQACVDELSAVEFIEKQRWGDTPACPRCGDTDVNKMQDKDGNRNKRYLWRCHGCKKQFTVRIGTIMEDSRIPFKVWCFAFWSACASKKGVSALQISRECNLSYKSALFLMHRIRYAMTEPEPVKLQGTVECDETYVGGRSRYKGHRKTGRSPEKTPVMAMVQRNGEVRARVITRATSKELKGLIRKHVDKSSRIMTDEWRSYRGIGSEFAGGHHTVYHAYKEYAFGDIYTNTAECFFSMLKRGIYGVFHSVSKKHLHRYVGEFEFRWNTRHLDDGKRLRIAIRGAEGKRLMYYQPTS